MAGYTFFIVAIFLSGIREGNSDCNCVDNYFSINYNQADLLRLCVCVLTCNSTIYFAYALRFT